ncbi:hypothetical protein DNU06_11015 [Putridiphycobacter roseus]|uniref:Uncharacterized protein n=2 Tax=Putridiphycobacter roseus TaxID=2219161 RepID=A0A2W1NCH8_9FLAO|nr:hypothetical protein DNU06_11015 [Putridiphycobacter roseus]
MIQLAFSQSTWKPGDAAIVPALPLFELENSQVQKLHPLLILAKDNTARENRLYALVTGGLYLGAFTGDIIGTNLRLDFMVNKSKNQDVGIGFKGQVGAPFDDDLLYSLAAYALAFYGKSSNRFEISLGANLPFKNYFEPYELVHFGIGYRYISVKTPLTFTIGMATTSLFHIGLGFKIG